MLSFPSHCAICGERFTINHDCPRPAGALARLDSAYLQHRRFVLLLDSQDIAATCESIGRDPSDVSGILADVADGDYVEVWITGYRRPHELASVYECVKARKVQP